MRSDNLNRHIKVHEKDSYNKLSQSAIRHRSPIRDSVTVRDKSPLRNANKSIGQTELKGQFLSPEKSLELRMFVRGLESKHISPVDSHPLVLQKVKELLWKKDRRNEDFDFSQKQSKNFTPIKQLKREKEALVVDMEQPKQSKNFTPVKQFKREKEALTADMEKAALAADIEQRFDSRY